MSNHLRRFFLLSFALAWIGLPVTARAQKGTIKIAVQVPLSGEQAALGEHIKLGAQLAVEESSKGFKALGYNLILVPYDDQAKPEVGVANASSGATGGGGGVMPARLRAALAARECRHEGPNAVDPATKELVEFRN